MRATFDSLKFYDELGDVEWERLVRDPAARASLEVHRRFLRRFVEPGDRVLEVGAGPGRFTIELAALGARVHVTDISPVQLELNRQHVATAGAEAAVIGRDLLDVRDVSRFDDDSFDVVLAYGGPLSYAFDAVEQSLHELLRVTRPGGYVVASVMSMLGTWRHTLRGVAGIAEDVGDHLNDEVLRTGDLRHLPDARHTCLMFRADQLRGLIAAAGGHVEAMSSSHWASLGDPETVARLEADPARWAHFIENEITACAEAGALDGGTHLLFATRPELPGRNEGRGRSS